MGTNTPLKLSSFRSSAPRSLRFVHADMMFDLISCFEVPLRRTFLRSVPFCAYRHKYHIPSAVSRLRSQVLQNGEVVEAMTPKIVPSRRTNRSAGAVLTSLRRSMRPYRRFNTLRMSAREKTLSIDHCVAPPTSMYSMKRTSAPTRFPYSNRSTSSSSLVPRMTTVSIFNPVKPTCRTVEEACQRRQVGDAVQ